MEEVIVEAQLRDKTGKSANKKLHTDGKIPAVVYKRGEGAISLALVGKDLFRALHTKAGENVIITLKINDSSKKEKDRTVIIKEPQHHPLRGDILHVDFNQISLTQAIKVSVPIFVKGEAAGVKEGGVLEHVLWEIEVECLPREIPEKIEVDVSALKINDSLFVKDISVPGNIKVLTGLQLIAISVKPPVVEKPAAEVAAEAVATEPEVIKQKKPEELEAEAAEKKKEKEGKEK